MSNFDYIVLSKSELEIRQWEIVFNWDDVERLIEWRKVFTKFLNKSINKIQADLWSLLYIKREAEAYVEINALREVIKSIDKTVIAYKAYLQKIENDKDMLRKAVAAQENQV
jgi:hypothetical protein